MGGRESALATESRADDFPITVSENPWSNWEGVGTPLGIFDWIVEDKSRTVARAAVYGLRWG